MHSLRQTRVGAVQSCKEQHSWRSRRRAQSTEARATAEALDASAGARRASPQELFWTLGLETFSSEEMRASFESHDADGDGLLSAAEVASIFSRTCDTAEEAEVAAAELVRR